MRIEADFGGLKRIFKIRFNPPESARIRDKKVLPT
jgi:hypothetical protein